MSEYVRKTICRDLPRLPLSGCIDLTYRCNNNCCHCWLWTPDTEAASSKELSFDEIRHIVDDARALGCRSWSISGGEPMLRPDFEEIFDYISGKGPYSLNTNGTLITPSIASLMKRPGTKMIALYGATADIHDHITRTPGSFDTFLRGCALLKDAGAAFMVQIIPMRDNYHQLKEMISLAESLSPVWRIGAAWLYLSASADKQRNAEILSQRLSPEQVIAIDPPDVAYEEMMSKASPCCAEAIGQDNHIFASCISSREDFHIDPYGQASFCSYAKDPLLRYDLKHGSMKEFWEDFMPSLTTRIAAGDEYNRNCKSCELRADCRWCGVYAYLEHGSYSAKVDYLCEVAKENRKYKEDWKKSNRRYYKNADITIQVDSDLPITDSTFDRAVRHFEVAEPGDDIVFIRHHFSLPDLKGKDLGQEVYRRPPFAIYKKGDSWIYLGISSDEKDAEPYQVAIFNRDHSAARIFHGEDRYFRQGGLNSLCLFPTDQILIARLMSNRKGFYLHSAGLVYKGHGLLFVGHSEAGKSTTVKMFRDSAEILCDDRIILRKQDGIWNIHGTWSHGEVPDVSPGSAPLSAIFFLEQSELNRIIPVNDSSEALLKMLPCVIKPFVDADWWDNTLAFMEDVSRTIPCYRMMFDKSGSIIPVLDAFVQSR